MPSNSAACLGPGVWEVSWTAPLLFCFLCCDVFIVLNGFKIDFNISFLLYCIGCCFGPFSYKKRNAKAMANSVQHMKQLCPKLDHWSISLSIICFDWWRFRFLDLSFSALPAVESETLCASCIRTTIYSCCPFDPSLPLIVPCVSNLLSFLITFPYCKTVGKSGLQGMVFAPMKLISHC